MSETALLPIPSISSLSTSPKCRRRRRTWRGRSARLTAGAPGTEAPNLDTCTPNVRSRTDVKASSTDPHSHTLKKAQRTDLIMSLWGLEDCDCGQLFERESPRRPTHSVLREDE